MAFKNCASQDTVKWEGVAEVIKKDRDAGLRREDKRMDEYWVGRRERLRRQVEKEGWDSLCPHEMIELILYYTVLRQDMNEVACALLSRFGSVRGVMNATKEELKEIPGMNEGMAEWLKHTAELIHAYEAIGPEEHFKIKKHGDAIDFVSKHRKGAKAPECWILYMDFDNRLLTQTVLCKSLKWWKAEHVRQCIREALALHARYAILVEFRGTQALEIGNEEKEQLVQFSHALRGIEVELLDDILVGETEYVSLHAKGRMDKIRQELVDTILPVSYTHLTLPTILRV